MEIKRGEGAVYWLRHIEGQLWRWTKAIEDHTQTLRKANYNPSEARVPAGQTGGGQWTSGGGGRFGGGIRKPSRNSLLRRISDDEEDEASPYTTHPYNPMRRDAYAPPTKPAVNNVGFTDAEIEVEKIRGGDQTKIHLERARGIPQNVQKVSEVKTRLQAARKKVLKILRKNIRVLKKISP